MVDIAINENDGRVIVVATSNGQAVFNFDFPVFESTHLSVLYNGDLLDLTTDYIVTGIEQENGGTVTLEAPVAATVLIGDEFTIERNIPIERIADYAHAGDFRASTINRELDTFVMIQQDLKRDIGDGEDATESVYAALLAEAAARAAEDLRLADLIMLGDGILFDAPDYPSRAAIEAISIDPTVTYFRVAGYAAAGDGGEALYKRAASEPVHAGKVQSDDGAWFETTPDPIKAAAFGVTDRTGGTDHTTQLQAAANAATTLGTSLRLGAGTILISAMLTFTNLVVQGEGSEKTIVEMAPSASDQFSLLPHGFLFTGLDGGGYNFSVRGRKEEIFLATYPAGGGRNAIRGETTRQFFGLNLYVEDWLGTCYRLTPGGAGRGSSTLENCRGYNCGRPAHSPGTEFGDFIYVDGGAQALVLNCHYEDPLSAGERMTRGGIVSTDEGEIGVLNIIACSIINAHRSIHLEQIPLWTNILGFYGEFARNGIMIFGTLDRRRTIVARDCHFHLCAGSADGVITTGAALGLELFGTDILITETDPLGDIYRHHQDGAPAVVHFTRVRDDGSPITSIVNSAAGEMGELALTHCDLTGGMLLCRLISKINVDGGVYKNWSGNNAGNVTPRRQYRFGGGVVIGRGLTDGVAFEGTKYADIIFDGVVWEHNSTDGSHPLFNVLQAQVTINQPKFTISGTAPTTAWVCGGSCHITLNLNNPLSIAVASVASILTKSGTGTAKAFGYIIPGTAAANDPASIAAGVFGASVNVTVTGAAITDRVKNVRHSSGGAVIWAGVVSAANTVTCVPFNPTGAAIDLASGTLTAEVEKAMIP